MVAKMSASTLVLLISCILFLVDETKSGINWKKFQPRKLAKNMSDAPKKVIHARNNPCLCVPIRDCPPLLSLLSIHPVHPEIVEFLKNQSCGFHGFDPLVCCFTENDPYAPTPPTVTHPRIERCMSVSEEDVSVEIDVRNSNAKPGRRFSFHPGKKLDYTHYPPKPHDYPYPYYPWLYHGRGYYFYRRNKPSKNADQSNPDEKTSNDMPDVDASTTTTTTETSSRSQMLPDDICGLSLDQRIVGGRTAILGAYPWVARIGYTRPQSNLLLYRCGGTLISSRFVVTAAHCVTDLPDGLTLATVRLGEQDERSNPDCEGNECADMPQDFIPLKAIPHLEYNKPKYRNDIALIQLDKEAQITPYVTPICLPVNFMKNSNFTGQEGIVVGWGTVNVSQPASSPTLQEVSLVIANTSTCQSLYKTTFELEIGEDQMCTVGEKDKDACEGDSGGPLMRIEQLERNGVPRYYLLGIVSFGARLCGTADIPAVFTRVTNYVDWIVEQMNSGI